MINRHEAITQASGGVAVKTVDQRVSEITRHQRPTDALFETAGAKKFEAGQMLQALGLSEEVNLHHLAPAAPRHFPHIVPDHIKLAGVERVDAAIGAIADCRHGRPTLLTLREIPLDPSRCSGLRKH